MNRHEACKCKLFYCERRNGYICCADCGYKAKGCKDPCTNSPGRCGEAIPKKRRLEEFEHVCRDCGRTFLGGAQSKLCNECRRKAHAKSAKERNLTAIGTAARVKRAAERRAKKERTA